MKATGIVRRIDELGRVVIPKEIRRTLRIREGDPLEIFTDRDGEVILKKYSPVGELSNFAKEYTESLYRALGHVACISDKDLIISASGAPKKELFDKAVSPELENIMKNRRTHIASRKDGGFVPITADADESMVYTAQVITPIIVDGDPVGAVMLLSKEEDAVMGDTELKVCETAAGFVSRQMES
ncbi:MAG: stage V sporulation protein T [Christensenellales bacterium]|jgi:AbrB family transcriptional regulator (stage V sporulation protein T)